MCHVSSRAIRKPLEADPGSLDDSDAFFMSNVL